MCIGISSFDNINNDGSIETSGQIASANTGSTPAPTSLWGSEQTSTETSGSLASNLLFGGDLSLDAGSDVVFSSPSTGGGGCSSGGGMSLA